MYITLFRQGPAGTRYYTLHNRQGNLFTPYSLTVMWGNSSVSGREKLIILETRREMDSRIRYLLRRRLKDGYSVLYTYFRSDEHQYVRNLTKTTLSRSAAS